jgi:hypothetical protein
LTNSPIDFSTHQHEDEANRDYGKPDQLYAREQILPFHAAERGRQAPGSLLT